MIAWERRLLAALGRELAPGPTRIRATLRLTVVCLATVVVAMALHLPEIHWLVVTIFVVAQSDAQASVDKAIQRTFGTLIGGVAAILMVAMLAGKQELLLLALAGWVTLGIYLSKTQADSYVFVLFGVTVLVAIPDQVADPSRAVEMALIRIQMLAAGSLIGAVAQLVLWPEDPERQLIDDLTERLDLAVRALDHTVARRAFLPDALRERLLGPGMARQLDLLGRAEALDDRLRARHAEQLQLIAEIDRLVAAIILLRREARERPLAGDEIAAIELLALGLRAMLADLRRIRAHDRAIPALADGLTVRPAIVRLYEIAGGLPRSTGFLEIIARRSPPRAPIGRLPRFQPGTRFDPAALRLGVKAALAMTLCGLAYQVLLWPGITTCVVTAIIVIQPSRGASMRKALLRSAGAIAGGLFGFLALAVLGPSMGSLPALMIVAGIGIAGAAYVNVGSSRISYAGMQTVMAFGLVALDHETVAGNLAAGIDRVLGILLGIAVATLVDVFMWPTTARAAAAAKVVAAQEGLDALAADPADRATKTAAIHRDLAAAVAQFEDARWEMSSRPADRSALMALGRDIERVQRRFLALTVHPPEASGVVTR